MLQPWAYNYYMPIASTLIIIMEVDARNCLFINEEKINPKTVEIVQCHHIFVYCMTFPLSHGSEP